MEIQHIIALIFGIPLLFLLLAIILQGLKPRPTATSVRKPLLPRWTPRRMLCCDVFCKKPFVFTILNFTTYVNRGGEQLASITYQEIPECRICQVIVYRRFYPYIYDYLAAAEPQKDAMLPFQAQINYDKDTNSYYFAQEL